MSPDSKFSAKDLDCIQRIHDAIKMATEILPEVDKPSSEILDIWIYLHRIKDKLKTLSLEESR